MSNGKRKQRFSEEEMEVLLSGIELNKSILLQTESGPKTNAAKNRVWANLAENVRAVSAVDRTADEVRRKWVSVAYG